MSIRTDLALEEHQLHTEDTQSQTQLSGVKAREIKTHNIPVTVVEILNKEGADALHKPVGTYITLELTDYVRKVPDTLEPSTKAVAHHLKELLPVVPGETVMVIGLGNKAITADAVGPLVTEQLFVTRHLIDQVPEHFSAYRPTCVLAPGVLGMTGMESAEVVKALVAQIHPAALIVVDALASRSLSRVCTTVQISNSGIVPGSGIQNARAALNQENLGIPVLAVGVPTVVDMATLAEDYHSNLLADTNGMAMVVTPRDIDAKVLEISKAISYGINLALHPQLSMEDMVYFVE